MQPFAGLPDEQNRLRVHEREYPFQERVVEVVQAEDAFVLLGTNLRKLKANRNERIRVVELSSRRVDDDRRGQLFDGVVDLAVHRRAWGSLLSCDK